MKVWINEYLKNLKLAKQSFERDGNKVIGLILNFKDKSQITIYLTKNDLESLIKALPELENEKYE